MGVTLEQNQDYLFSLPAQCIRQSFRRFYKRNVPLFSDEITIWIFIKYSFSQNA